MVLEASHLDGFIGLAIPFVADPEFVQKIEKGQAGDINLDITGQLDNLKLPNQGFNNIEYLFGVGKRLP